MSKAKGKYCVRCFADIQQADVVSFTDSGLCDACFQAAKKKQRASDERQKTQIPPVKSYKSDNEITADVFLIGFACLFFIGPADLIFDFDLEYGFFMFLRLTAFFGFAYLAYQNWESEYKLADLPISYMFAGLAVLYNPFISVSLTREIWTPINIATGVLIFIFLQQKNKKINEVENNHTSLNTPPIPPVSAPPIKGPSRPSVWENKKPTSLEVPTNTKHEKANHEDVNLIIRLLMAEKSLMNKNIGYLDSIAALGFIAGLIDGYLQRLSKVSSAPSIDEMATITFFLETIFGDTKNSASRFFDVQDQLDPDFIKAQMEGGNQGLLLGGSLANKKLNEETGAGWLSHYICWCESNFSNNQEIQFFEKQNVKEISNRIIGLLKKEKFSEFSFDGASGYLRSNECVGFVAGFADVFLKSSSFGKELTKLDIQMANALIMRTIFFNTNKSVIDYLALKDLPDEIYLSAEHSGVDRAFEVMENINEIEGEEQEIGSQTITDLEPSSTALGALFESVEMLVDFVKRLDHVGDEELAALMVLTTKERLKFFKMSPDAHLWFSEPKKEHLEDLLNYQSASYLKIKAMQNSGETMEASFHMIMLHLTTGILHRRTNPSFSEAAINMWITIRERSRNHIADAIERHLEEHEDKDAFLAELYGWQPKALLDPIEDE